MQGDPQVIDFLNKALLNELTAINQYWLHYRMLDTITGPMQLAYVAAFAFASWKFLSLEAFIRWGSYLLRFR